MPSLKWTAFESLQGSKSQNFENICRSIIWLHYGRFGQFKALSNQPGVEFHIELQNTCPLGDPPQWFGWQCKFHTLKANGDLTTISRKKFEKSLRTTEEKLPGITDWVLWTPYTLSKSDQDWFYDIPTSMTLHLWCEEELDTHLSGDGLILRSTYFGELILTPEELKRRHQEAIQPIRERWLESVHQSVDAERTIRRMLGESGSWDKMITVGNRLKKVVDIISDSEVITPPQLEKTIALFATACSTFADTLLHFHEILADGNLDIIQQNLVERKTLIDAEIYATTRQLRACNLPIAL
ncbi:MAG: hypothetical protein KAJ03_00910, partial [Gammaproteobacteria bacterium]|nr:hypothetical protein [Gammaproteobacteria bacterium]